VVDVLVGHTVLASRRADSHLDNVPCLAGGEQCRAASLLQDGVRRCGAGPSNAHPDRLRPTGTGINPTLTIMANAWRVAEHIADGRDATV
jgi:choline dehydrogenase-like flavoprotein